MQCQSTWDRYRVDGSGMEETDGASMFQEGRGDSLGESNDDNLVDSTGYIRWRFAQHREYVYIPSILLAAFCCIHPTYSHYFGPVGDNILNHGT